MASVSKRKWTHNGVTKEAWVVRYFDIGGKRRGKTFERKKEADSYRLKVESEIAGGLHVAASPRTVAELMGEYMERQAERQRDKQISEYRVTNQRLHERYIVTHIGAAKLTSLTWQGVEAFGRMLRTAKLSHRNRRLAAGTVNGIMSTLGLALSFAERRGYIGRNPYPLATKELGWLREPAIETFTRDEIQRLLITIEDRGRRRRRYTAFQRCSVYLAAFCGLRAGEIMALTWEAIDFDRNAIHVRQSLTQTDKVKAPKTAAGWRSVPLPPVVAAALSDWRRFAVPDKRGLIFRNSVGKFMSQGNRWRAFGRLLVAAEFKPETVGQRHFHALRHFAGSAWLEMGIPLATVSTLLGHASPATTAKTYAHIIANPFDRAAEISNFAAALAPPRPQLTQESRMAA